MSKFLAPFIIKSLLLARRSLFAVVAVLFLSACFVPDSVKQAENIAQQLLRDGTVESQVLDTEEVQFHYVTRGEGQSLIVFVHGTPGDWAIFGSQIDSDALASKARLIGLDRPGWGESRMLAGKAPTTLEGQSHLIGPFLKELRSLHQSEHLILVGHSLGASLVPRIAMDYPQEVDAVVAIAGDLSPSIPAARWYNKFADALPVRWLIPGVMKRANAEVNAISPSLEMMLPLWGELDVPLLVIQGEKDRLVDPRHADFAENLKTKSVVKVQRFDESGHLLNVSAASEVNHLIEKVLLREENDFFSKNLD